MPRQLIDYSGLTIDEAKVLGRAVVKGKSCTTWNLRCLRCGVEFSCDSRTLKKRRHIHVCGDDRPAGRVNSIAAATASVRAANETSLHFPKPVITPMAAIVTEIRKPLTPEELGLLHAKQYCAKRNSSMWL